MLTSFQILGPLTVVDPCGVDLTPRSAHQRTLLADLIIHANQVVSIDRLLDDLWGERPPLTARSSLHNLVSRLRKALGAETVITRAPGYAILIQPEQLDSVCFERLVQKAMSRLTAAERRAYMEAAQEQGEVQETANRQMRRRLQQQQRGGRPGGGGTAGRKRKRR